MEELVELITCANAVQHTRFVRVLGKKLTRILQRETPLVWTTAVTCDCVVVGGVALSPMVLRETLVVYVCGD